MTPTNAIEESPRGTATTPEQQLQWLLSTVGIASLDATGWIRITGLDRVRWLNGMVTNSIQALKIGDGNYSFALNAQGQIQGDLTTFAEAETLLIETGRTQIATLLAHFDRFIIMDDVELEDISSTRFGLLVAGPQASLLLERIGLPSVPSGTQSLRSCPWHGQASIDLVAAHSPLVSRYELWTDALTHKALETELNLHSRTLGGGGVDLSAVEHLRFLEGTPVFGTDIREKNLAQETAQPRALHFAKGCYLGQEIVERIRSRGNVHRTFAAFRLEGCLPAAGVTLTVAEKAVGELSSVSSIPIPGGALQVGFGIVRREALEYAGPIGYFTSEGPGVAIPMLTRTATRC